MRGRSNWLRVGVDCAREINKQCLDRRSIRHVSAMATVESG